MIDNFAPLLAAVQRNCLIADARHARDLTLCNYLLAMREFYRWEHELPLGAPPPADEIKRWLAEREAQWESLGEEEFASLPVAGSYIDPFEAPRVNASLLAEGLAYGAGIGRFHRPHFFLARLERRQVFEGLTVLVCGCEYARDLAAIPAALQRDTVIVRQESLRQWLWEKTEAWGVRQQPGAMARALAAYGSAEDTEAVRAGMVAAETEAVILHERGEHAAGRLLGPDWEHMLADFRERRAELLARAVRDHLADCLSTLPELVARGAWGSLHFWFANLEGFRRDLFPQALAAYETWLAAGDPTALLEVAAAGRRHWLAVAEGFLDRHRGLGPAAGQAIAAASHDLSAIAL